MAKTRKFLSYLKNALMFLIGGVGLIALFFLGDKATKQQLREHPNRTNAIVTQCTSYTGKDSEGDQHTYYKVECTYQIPGGEQAECTFSGFPETQQIGSKIPIRCNEDWGDPREESSLEPMDTFVKVILLSVAAICAALGIFELVLGIRYLKMKQ